MSWKVNMEAKYCEKCIKQKIHGSSDADTAMKMIVTDLNSFKLFGKS
jgi:hypothetical protein